MEKKELSKGERIEEKLRSFFINSGYYVARGVKFSYEKNDVTDIDLFLYRRVSGFTRERINVDIKNKKSPQAFERILWANGLQKLLNFDKCIVATTERNHTVKKFADIYNTLLVDCSITDDEHSTLHRLSEEEFMSLFSNFKSSNKYNNRDWKSLYEECKSKLLVELDYSGFNSILIYLEYFLEKAIIDFQKKEAAIRLVYILISYLLISIDFILKDMAFLDYESKKKKIREGLIYGNFGKSGIDKILDMAIKIAGNNSPKSIGLALETSQKVNGLSEYFANNNIIKILFKSARDFETTAFNTEFIEPNLLTPPLKSTISIFLDYFDLDRKNFFKSTPTQGTLPL